MAWIVYSRCSTCLIWTSVATPHVCPRASPGCRQRGSALPCTAEAKARSNRSASHPAALHHHRDPREQTHGRSGIALGSVALGHPSWVRVSPVGSAGIREQPDGTVDPAVAPFLPSKARRRAPGQDPLNRRSNRAPLWHPGSLERDPASCIMCIYP